MISKTTTKMRLYDTRGARLYLTSDERQSFLKAAEDENRLIKTLCMTLCLTGCRISEALNLTIASVDLKDETIIFETLKKRQAGVFRAVPVPPNLLNDLNLVHGIKEAQKRSRGYCNDPLWDMCRKTAYTYITRVMKTADIKGKHATPKGLRHGFGVHAVNCGVPLNMLQKWLGHAQLSTTAIYADAQGAEARDIARRMWR